MTTDPRHALVHPDLVSVLALMPDLGGINEARLPELREPLKGPAPVTGPDGDVSVREISLPRPDGGQVRAFLYEPAVRSAGLLPALLNVHGGGYVLGTPGREDATMRAFVRTLGCVALSPAYRLAPEVPHPGGLDDCAAALAWLWAEADSLGIDRARIALRGVSAGGGLALGLALRTRDEGGPALCHLSLVYPMIDDRTEGAESLGQFVWTLESNRFGWDALLRGHDRANPPAFAVPARAQSVAGLPPTFIGVGSIDLFAPENLDLAGRLITAGVPVELHVYPGAYHGFVMVAGSGPAETFRRDETAALTRALAPKTRAPGATTQGSTP